MCGWTTSLGGSAQTIAVPGEAVLGLPQKARPRIKEDPGESKLEWSSCPSRGQRVRTPAGRCRPIGRATPARSLLCAGSSMPPGCGIGWTSGPCRPFAAKPTWCSPGPRWRCSWTAASSTAVRSTSPIPRRTPTTGSRRSTGTRAGTQSRPGSSSSKAGRSCATGSTSRRRRSRKRSRRPSPRLWPAAPVGAPRANRERRWRGPTGRVSRRALERQFDTVGW